MTRVAIISAALSGSVSGMDDVRFIPFPAYINHDVYIDISLSSAFRYPVRRIRISSTMAEWFPQALWCS